MLNYNTGITAIDNILSRYIVSLRKVDSGSHYLMSLFVFFVFFLYKLAYLMTNSVDQDQLVSSKANLSEFTLFATVRHIQIQLDQG